MFDQHIKMHSLSIAPLNCRG
uniref:Uncharacterized protein n=1 Tax=Anopheles arabiensis TaxID=7173 RepID=A0A182IHV2_ANOAR